jgi:hypothetical protein
MFCAVAYPRSRKPASGCLTLQVLSWDSRLAIDYKKNWRPVAVTPMAMGSLLIRDGKGNLK